MIEFRSDDDFDHDIHRLIARAQECYDAAAAAESSPEIALSHLEVAYQLLAEAGERISGRRESTAPARTLH